MRQGQFVEADVIRRAANNTGNGAH
jgi:hypothetical protein